MRVLSVYKNMAFTLQSGLAAEPGGTLKLAFSAKEGSLIYDESGLRLSLAKKIGAGGEGEVFKLHDGRVCKIFRPVRVTQAVIAKLKLMVEHGAPKGAAVCWPESLAVSNGLQPEWLGGYIMPAAEGIPLQHLLLKPSIERQFPHWRRRHLVQLAVTILRSIAALHAENVLLGDINLLNILVKDENTVFFVDCDSFQINSFACPVGKLPFIRPCRAIEGSFFSKNLREMDDELFAVAVLLFMILLPGKPPFSHTGGGDVVANSRNARFPYPWGRRRAEGMPSGPWQYIWSHLTENLKIQFGEAFEEEKLPPVALWLKLLGNYQWAIEQGHSCDELFPATIKERDADAIVASGGVKLRCLIKGCGREFGVKDTSKLKYQICPQCRSKRYSRQCPLCGAGFFVSATQILRAEETKWNLFCPSCWDNCRTITKSDGTTYQESPAQALRNKIRERQRRNVQP